MRVGVPYGSRARLILLYLQTQAIRSQSPEVELGRSMDDWLGRMGISSGGKTRIDVRDQAERISACNLSFFWNDEGRSGFSKSTFVTDAICMRTSDTEHAESWTDTVCLSDKYFKALKDHPVPIWEPALREIGNRSMAMDIYVWLAYRLHVLECATPVSWAAIQEQFGAGFAATGGFRRSFKESLAFALAVYPDAKVDVTETGLTLRPSRPPIDKAKCISFAKVSVIKVPMVKKAKV
jgi:hypothetical protein